MRDNIVIEHENKIYKIALDDLAQFEVKDEASKSDLSAELEKASGGDEVEGFARQSAWVIIRR